MSDKFTFNGAQKKIYCKNSSVVDQTFSFSIYELYSDWKRWIYQDGENLKYLPAFRTIGGDPIGGGAYVGFYLFLRNDFGWRLVPPNTNNITISVEGSLFGESPNVAIMDQISGNTTQLIINRSSLSLGVQTGDGGFTSTDRNILQQTKKHAQNTFIITATK